MQQERHGEILLNFDKNLENLKSFPISDVLIQFVRGEKSANDHFSKSLERTGSITDLSITDYSVGELGTHRDLNAIESKKRSESSENIRSILFKDQPTLFDIVPVERERVWANQCRSVHSKVQDTLTELDNLYEKVQVLVQKLDDPTINFETLNSILSKVPDYLKQQNANVNQLRDDYGTMCTIVAQRQESSTDNDAGNDASKLTVLENKRISQEVLLNETMTLTQTVMDFKNIIASSKTSMMKCLSSRITLIAVVQTDIQKMMERLYQMRKWYKGRNEFFSHLENIGKLPRAYEFFLREIIRRQHYHDMIKSKVKTFTETIMSTRERETILREQFMQDWGKYLPPIFAEMVPSLSEKPPYHTVKLEGKEIPILPNVTDRDLTRSSMLQTSETKSEITPIVPGKYITKLFGNRHVIF